MFTETPEHMLRDGWVLCSEAARLTKHAVQTLYRWVDAGKVVGDQVAGYRRYVKWSSLLDHLGPEATALELPRELVS